MILLTVVSFKGQPADGSLSAGFDELGGTIGRADDNQLALPDPDRTISRKSAQVVYRNGEYFIVDRGSNPVSVNQQQVGNGRETRIREGDMIQIGGYELRVSKARGEVTLRADDPFADLLGPAAVGSPPARGGAAPLFDPLSLQPSSPPAGAVPAAGSSSAGGARAVIPEDWDPFAEPARPAHQADALGLSSSGLGAGGQFGLDTGTAPSGPLVPGSGGGAKPGDLDSLFGLSSSSSDPLANSILAPPSAAPNMAAHADPLRSLNAAPVASAAAARDDISDLQRPFDLPPMRPAAPAAAPAAIAPPAARPPARPLPSGAVLSWEEQPIEGHTVIRPKSPAVQVTPVAPAAAPSAASGSAPRAVPAPLAAAVPPAAAVAQAPADLLAAAAPAPAARALPAAAGSATDSGDSGELLQALLRGLGEGAPPITRLTPTLMELVGQLLAESTRGTLDLLAARAAIKREIRSDVTMIATRENNPLKFSPNLAVALEHLLGPGTPGFMPPERAMRDAYADLRAHQFAFVAGMRAALEGVLARFDPAQLDARLAKRPVLAALLPGSRKARMWEEFESMYAHIREEAAEDFHSLFGRAFLRAYEEHLDMLDRKQRG